jgi:GTP-binding protein
MPVPKVAIVGRPNVGKSSLLNWLAGKLVSVVDPTAGVTRDRVGYLMHHGERYFELIDTGGIGIVDSDDLSEEIERQIDTAMREAALVLFVTDGQTGPVPLDEEVARRLHALGKPVLLVVNKCDSPKTERDAPEFLRLVRAPLVTTSVTGNRNKADLLQALTAELPPVEEQEREEGARLAEEPELKLAIVGRRNVGKSTFVNALAEDERVIVSEVPGTTRDSIDVRFEADGRIFTAIDTPGVRKRKSLANDIEFYGLVRAQKSIRRADVVLVFLDATATVSQVDKHLVQEVVDRAKPCIFVVNKWDLGLEQEMTSDRWGRYLAETFPTLDHVPVAFVTAKDGRNVRQLINLAQSLFKQARARVSTAELNRVVREALVTNPPASDKGRRAKILYATQVGTEPPTIVLKCNRPKQFSETWKRFLLGFLRDRLPFPEVPIRLNFRARGASEPDAPGLEETPADKGVDEE